MSVASSKALLEVPMVGEAGADRASLEAASGLRRLAMPRRWQKAAMEDSEGRSSPSGMDASVRIQQRMARFNFQGHDELVYIVPDREVGNAKEILLEEMQRRPVWAPELPLAAETGEGKSYGAAK